MKKCVQFFFFYLYQWYDYHATHRDWERQRKREHCLASITHTLETNRDRVRERDRDMDKNWLMNLCQPSMWWELICESLSCLACWGCLAAVWRDGGLCDAVCRRCDRYTRCNVHHTAEMLLRAVLLLRVVCVLHRTTSLIRRAKTWYFSFSNHIFYRFYFKITYFYRLICIRLNMSVCLVNTKIKSETIVKIMIQKKIQQEFWQNFRPKRNIYNHFNFSH